MNIRFLAAILATCIVTTPAQAASFDEQFPEFARSAPQEIRDLIGGLDYKTGPQTVGDNLATINVKDGYYFLDAKDAAHVLTTVWGNPKGPQTLGMIFPDEKNPLQSDWGLEITYDDIGYVSDEDAAEYDYSELLTQMQADIRAGNPWRLENGYPAMSLVGWAADPKYDVEGRKLYWAQELNFEGSQRNTLNYNVRVLGRRGVLVMNFIASIDQLPVVNDALSDVLSMAEFTEGNRYADFDPSIDTVAAVGIGGLIAGKVLAKTGFLAAGLILLKKFWFIALLPLLVLKNRIFGRRDS